MKKCPFCAEEIQDEAIKCRYCGEFLDGRPARPMAMGYPGLYTWGYEYRSRSELWGWPLVHVASGINPRTGRLRVARGIIAVGNVAVGLVAVGGFALGGLVIGGVGLGALALAGVSLGGVALGGTALGLYLAVGGVAVSGGYALGGIALAPHAVSALGADAEFARALDRWIPGIAALFEAHR